MQSSPEKLAITKRNRPVGDDGAVSWGTGRMQASLPEKLELLDRAFDTLQEASCVHAINQPMVIAQA
ncbi:hypothetical protein HRbin15_00680 [bacterium HR15]|nr:hypothetical protein HRbin15_00680 [bacterium HR15]